MKKFLLSLLALGALPLSQPCVCAKDKAKEPPPVVEQTHKLEKMEVTTNPFADWGLNMHGQIGYLNKLIGGPPKNMFISTVFSRSPGDIAGVQLGDEVTAVNGKKITELPWRDLVRHFKNTERGDEVALELYNRATKQRRSVVLNIKSNKSWAGADNNADINCWGIVVRVEKGLRLGLNVNSAEKCGVGLKNKPAVEGKKKRTKQKDAAGEADYVFRRTVYLTAAQRSIKLLEIENQTVTVIDLAEGGGAEPHNLQTGAMLTLKADGTYDIQDAPAETVPSPATLTNATPTQP